MKQLNVPQCANPLVEKLLSILSNGATSGLNEKQLYGVMFASTFATNNISFINDILNAASDFNDEVTINAAKSVASLTNLTFKNSGLPCLEPEITIENPDKEYIRSSHTSYTQVYEINNNQIDDFEFQIYLLAASFVADFDRYVELREEFIEGKIVSNKVITSVIHIAATIHSISELVVSNLDRKKRILVVDDEVRMTRMLKLTLEKTSGFTVRTENKGANALNAARTFKPDLILLDVLMPDMGGENVAAKIREDAELSDTKIVFLTSLLTTAETGNTGKKIGRFMFLAKPIRGDDLIHCIENQINTPNFYGI